MAQVKIYAKHALKPQQRVLSDAIHNAVVAALQYPLDKRFHRFFWLNDSDFMHPRDRTDHYLIIEISMFEGRSVETKKQLIHALYERISAATGIVPQDIEITIYETPRHAWGIRGVPGDEIGLDYRVEV
jgi:phenylpyruvate tautomerase PptA (4-oxalocrotonate tautomerase family)